MSQKTKTTTSDLVMGVILLLFGIYLVIDALGMKIYNSFLDAPGFFPFILGIVFIGFGVTMLVTSIRSGGVKEAQKTFESNNLAKLFLSNETKRVIILLAIMVFYIFILIGRINFTVATFIYLFVTFFYLKSTTLIKNIIISLLTALIISGIFKYLFIIPLP
jgi:hypothetical protein